MASSPLTLSPLTPTRWADFLKAEAEDDEGESPVEEAPDKGVLRLRVRTDLSLCLERSFGSEPNGTPSPLSNNLTRLCAVNWAIWAQRLGFGEQSMEIKIETAHEMKKSNPRRRKESITCARKSPSPHIFPAHFTSYLLLPKIVLIIKNKK